MFLDSMARIGQALRPLEQDGWTVLADRHIPRSRSFLDYLLIGPAGVVVVKDEGRINPSRRTEMLAAPVRGAIAACEDITEHVALLAYPDTPALTPVVALQAALWGQRTRDGAALVGVAKLARFVLRLPAQLPPRNAATLALGLDAILERNPRAMGGQETEYWPYQTGSWPR